MTHTDPIFLLMLRAARIPQPVAEHKFHADRKWRFDYCWPTERVAVEVEGGVWIKGRHTRGSGFVKDMEKYNAAGELGWRVLRYTPQQLHDGKTIEQIANTLNGA